MNQKVSPLDLKFILNKEDANELDLKPLGYSDRLSVPTPDSILSEGFYNEGLIHSSQGQGFYNEGLIHSSQGQGFYSSTVNDQLEITPNIKPKRKRATQQQVQILEQVFRSNRFPTTVERQLLASTLRMAPRAVQIWFQNKRQITKLRQYSQFHPDLNLPSYVNLV